MFLLRSNYEAFLLCHKLMTATFHSKNPAMQDSILVFNQDCELVSQLPNNNLSVS